MALCRTVNDDLQKGPTNGFFKASYVLLNCLLTGFNFQHIPRIYFFFVGKRFGNERCRKILARIEIIAMQSTIVNISVADPGSGAFSALHPGSGLVKIKIRIRDPGPG
jgi:hypothetical protein